MPLGKKTPNNWKEPAFLQSETAAAAAKAGFSVRILILPQNSHLLNNKSNDSGDHYHFSKYPGNSNDIF